MEQQIFAQVYDRIYKMMALSMQMKYYRNLFNNTGINISDIHSYNDFRHIPITSKEDYRTNSLQFVDDNRYNLGFNDKIYADKKRASIPDCLAYLHSFNMDWRISSGSTGVPLEIIVDIKGNTIAQYNLNLYRQSMAGEFLQLPYVWMWSVNSLYRERYNKTIDDRNYIPHNHGYQYFIWEFSDTVFGELMEFLFERNIKWLIAAPSVLTHLCDYIIKTDHKNIPNILYIECQSEYLSDWQEKLIYNIFGVHPSNVYSANEILFMAVSCNQGKMHVLTRNVFIELIGNDEGSKEVVATSLYSRSMPFIRYSLGDCAKWGDELCDCNMAHLPSIEIKQFRKNDLFAKADGTYLDFWIIQQSVVLLQDKFEFTVSQYKVIQTSYYNLDYQLRINKIINNNKIKRIENYLINYYKTLLGYSVQVNLTIVNNSIANENSSGKYKYFTSLVSK